MTTQVLEGPTRDHIDYRAINAKAIKYWNTLFFMLVDLGGRPLGEVMRLNPNFIEQPHGTRRHGAPQLLELRGPSPWDGGSWTCLGNGACGADVVDLIAYLGECPRPVAADWLGRLVDRVVEMAA